MDDVAGAERVGRQQGRQAGDRLVGALAAVGVIADCRGVDVTGGRTVVDVVVMAAVGDQERFRRGGLWHDAVVGRDANAVVVGLELVRRDCPVERAIVDGIHGQVLHEVGVAVADQVDVDRIGRAADAPAPPGDRHCLTDLEFLLPGRGGFLQELDGAGGRRGRIAVEPLVYTAAARVGLVDVGRCGVAGVDGRRGALGRGNCRRRPGSTNRGRS